MSTESLIIDLDGSTPPRPAAPVVIEDAAPAVVVDEDAGEGGTLPKRATRNEDGSVTLKLISDIPIITKKDGVASSTTYESLTFHRLRGADVRAINSAAKADQPHVLLARSARIREMVMGRIFDLMDAEDIVAATQIVEGFFGSGPKTRP